MRLPERVRTQQMSLGREDVSAPGELMRVRQRAQQMILSDVAQFVGNVNDVFFAQDTAAAAQRKNSLILSNKIRNAELQAYLTNTPQINIRDPNLPPEVREYIVQQYPAGRVPENVPTHEIMVPFMSQHMEHSIGESLAQIPGMEAEFLNAMTTQVTGIAGDMVKETVRQRQNALKAQVNENFELAIMSGDLDEAFRIVEEAVNTGAYTPEEGAERIRTAANSIAKNDLDTRISTSESQEDLDLVANDLFSRRLPLTNDDTASLARRLNSRRRELETERNTFRSEQYMAGELQLMQGTLTEDWITRNLAEQNLTATQARSLRQALNSPPPVKSDPELLDNLRGRIAMLPFPMDDEPVPLETRHRQLRRSVQQAFTGTTEGGEFAGRRLSGADFQQLMQELDTSVNRAMGQNNRDYELAMDTIRTFTGVSDRILNALSGDAPQRAAYMAFRQELQRYLDYKGPNDPPLYMWVQQNAHRFDPVKYENDYLTRMRARFPRYASLMQDPSYDFAGVIDSAQVDLAQGLISLDKYESLVNALSYKALMEVGDVAPTNTFPLGR